MSKFAIFAGVLLLQLLSFSECMSVENKKRQTSPPVVTTPYGQVMGIQDTNATMFLGIPYAEAPIGDLRWRETVDVKPWRPNVLQATDYKPSCPQAICKPVAACPNITAEDCLYLNVFVPLDASESNLKAVMLFIHGGNFQYFGSSSPLFDGRFLANQGDVVVVTINYRLGALGYLVTGIEDDQLHGNFGILDQRMAIRWVKNNIKAFFGDPDRITVFGQSAGAQSTSIHLLSNDMQEYFNNAIIQSSPYAIPFREFDQAMGIYFYFSQYLNCALRDLACLKSKTIEEIIHAQMLAETKVTSISFLDFFEPWLPYLDGKIIRGQLLEFEKWNLPKDFRFKPMIVGTLTGECYNYIYEAFTKPVSIKEYAEILAAAFKEKAPLILEHYPPDITHKDQREVMTKMCTRWVFACGSRNFLEMAQYWNPTKPTVAFQYVFDFPLDFPGWDGDLFCYNYSCHGSDCPYTFDVPDANFTSDGHYMAKTHIEHWSNFAKTNNTMTSKGITWPPYDPKLPQFLRFIKPKNSIESGYLSAECSLFDSIGYYH